MNTWATAVITEKGIALQTKLIKGNTLEITRAVVGTGFVPVGLLPKQSGVIEPKQEVEIQPVTYPEEGKCAMPVVLSNKDVTTGYQADQIAIFAMDPDEGEICYFIAQANLPDDKRPAGYGTTVPAKTEMPGYSAEWTFYFQYGQADSVHVTVNPSGSVSKDDLQNYFVAITNAEIDAAFGSAYTPSEDIGGTANHALLFNREQEDQHPISAITDLEETLDGKIGEEDAMTPVEIDNIIE